MNEHRVTIPSQLQLYQRGAFPAGALPGAGTTIDVPIFASDMRQVGHVMNHQDNSQVAITLRAGVTHALRRYAGLWIVDIFLFQDQPATISLRERVHDEVNSALPGLLDLFRTVYTRQVRANVPFRQSWRIYGQEARIRYINGVTPVTTLFQFSAIARSA